MTDLPDDANERIAEACGFTIYDKSGRKVSVDEYGDSCNRFDPATDPAAALFALEAYGDKHDMRYTQVARWKHHKTGKTRYSADLEDNIVCEGDSFCQAICRAILQAEKERKSCQ